MNAISPFEMRGFCNNRTDTNEKPNISKDPQCLPKNSNCLNCVACPHSWLWGISREKKIELILMACREKLTQRIE